MYVPLCELKGQWTYRPWNSRGTRLLSLQDGTKPLEQALLRIQNCRSDVTCQSVWESLHRSANQRVDQLSHLIVTTFSSTSITLHTLGDPALKGEMKCATQIGDARNQRNTHENSCHKIFSQLRDKDQQNQRIQQKYTTPEMFLLPPAEQTKVPDEQKLEHEENNQNPKKSRQGSR